MAQPPFRIPSILPSWQEALIQCSLNCDFSYDYYPEKLGGQRASQIIGPVANRSMLWPGAMWREYSRLPHGMVPFILRYCLEIAFSLLGAGPADQEHWQETIPNCLFMSSLKLVSKWNMQSISLYFWMREPHSTSYWLSSTEEWGISNYLNRLLVKER